MTGESKRKLSEGLDRLRAELKNLKADDETRQRLEDLARRVERQLQQEGGAEEHHSLVQELEDEILRFEVAHPRLTAIINDIMVALSQMGI